MHAVAITESPILRILQARRFVADALAAGGSALMIAKPDLLEAVVEDLNDSVRCRVVMRDADQCLEHLDQNGLDPVNFEALIEPLLVEARQSGTGKVAAIGELVAILWAQGRRRDAMRVEQYWERLLGDVGLLCLYPMELFSNQMASVAPVLDTHSHIHVEDHHRIGYPSILSL